jgi:type I restriction enzyme, R subunit
MVLLTNQTKTVILQTNMNETETRAELIDPQLLLAGWTTGENVRVRREFPITAGKIGGSGNNKLKADYVLEFKGHKLAIIEAKKSALNVGEGVAQAKLYANKLQIRYTYATNGK